MHLLNRPRHFFTTGSMDRINERIKNINAAMSRSNRQVSEIANDIRDFFPTIVPEPRPKKN